MLLDIDKVFYIALGLLAFMLLTILLKILIDVKRSAKTRAEISRFIENEHRRRIGERHLCSDCKLHKWFMIGIDGEGVIKVPGKVEVYEETLLFKGKVPE